MESVNKTYIQTLLSNNESTKNITLDEKDSISINCEEVMIRRNNEFVIIINNNKVIMYKKY